MKQIFKNLGFKKMPITGININTLQQRDYENLVYSKYPSRDDLVIQFKSIIYTKSLRDFLLFEIVTESINPEVRKSFYETLQKELQSDLRRFRKEGMAKVIYFFFDFEEEIQIAAVMLDYVKEKLNKLNA